MPEPGQTPESTEHNAPQSLPGIGRDGDLVRSLSQVVLERRQVASFADEPVADELLDAMLKIAAEAPSFYNLQPWRFVIVRDPALRGRLRSAVTEQELLTAPVLVVALGAREDGESLTERIQTEVTLRSGEELGEVAETAEAALDFVTTVPSDVWAARQTMTAFTVLMLAAGSYGFDTAIIDDFDTHRVRQELGVPQDVEVVAILAIGRAAREEQRGGHLPLERLFYAERYGEAWVPYQAANTDSQR
jgi:nitroreductase